VDDVKLFCSNGHDHWNDRGLSPAMIECQYECSRTLSTCIGSEQYLIEIKVPAGFVCAIASSNASFLNLRSLARWSALELANFNGLYN
jgi:hypothetical protein